MAQEYFINSQTLEDKVRKLLPTQGGAGAGFDLSASTQIIPIIDLTESAEGSNLRQDLQTSLSHSAVTSFIVSNTTTTLINTTGYWRVFGAMGVVANTVTQNFTVNDGSTDKIILNASIGDATTIFSIDFDFVVYLQAGDSLKAISSDSNAKIAGCTRQIADISGDLVNP